MPFVYDERFLITPGNFLYSCFSRRDAQDCIKGINERVERGRIFLAKAKVLFLTLGSSWAYKLRQNDIVRSMIHDFHQARLC